MSDTLGCSMMIDSISAGDRSSPPRLMHSFLRPVKKIQLSLSVRPRSPVLKSSVLGDDARFSTTLYSYPSKSWSSMVEPWNSVTSPTNPLSAGFFESSWM